MDEKLMQAMLQDLNDAVGYTPLPEHAKTFDEWKAESPLTEDTLRKALKKCVESGTWIKQRVGRQTYYWRKEND